MLQPSQRLIALLLASALSVLACGQPTTGDDPVATPSTTSKHAFANTPAMARDNLAAVTEDTTLTDSGNVITDNDGYGADAIPSGTTPSVRRVNATNLAASGNTTIAGSYGSLAINRAGTYTYTLNNSLAAVQALIAGTTLSDPFTYRLEVDTVMETFTYSAGYLGTNNSVQGGADAAWTSASYGNGYIVNPNLA